MKSSIRLALPLVGAALLAACGTSSADLMTQGERAYAQNRYQEARVDFSKVLQQEPANIGAMDKLIRTYLAMEDPVAVEGLLDRMAQLGYLPEDAPVLYGEADLMLGRYESAIARARQSNSADALRIQALANAAGKNHEQAIALFRQGANAPGSKGKLLAAHAHYLLGRGELAEARKIAAAAIGDDPPPLLGLLTMADIEQINGRAEQALEWYDRTLKIYPESRAAMIGRIAMLGELERFAQLEPVLKDLRERFPHDAGYIYLDARLAAEQDDWTKVRELLQPLERELTTMPAANILYARAMLGLGHVEQARVRLSSHLLREPGNREARFYLATAKMSVGDPSGAVETLRPSVEGEDATAQEIALMAEANRAAGGA